MAQVVNADALQSGHLTDAQPYLAEVHQALAVRLPDDDKWVPYLYRQHWLKKLCARAGVKQFGFHGIRHLFASILASKNVPLVEIQKMLRHGSIATTQRYIHSLQEGSREAIEALPGLESVTDYNQLKERKEM